MKNKKLKFKKIFLHPITELILLTGITIIISFILSLLKVSVTTSTINMNSGNIEQEIVTVKNMLSYDGIKYMIGNAAKNFMSFNALSILLITLIGISIAEFTGLINTFFKRTILKLNPKFLTFIIILLSIFSSIVNEVGYAIMIPLSALLFLLNGRNPLVGICAAYAGVAFGYGISFFAGAMEISLVPITKLSAQLIDPQFHVSLTSNIFIMIVTSVLIAIVATIITEKIIVKKIGRYFVKTRDDLGQTREIEYLDLKYEEQKKITEEANEKRGLRRALIAAIIVIAIFIYMIIPGLPLSGMLLDTNEFAYVNQLFGENSYFQDGFTYMVSIFFIVTGISYGFGAKTIKSDKDIANGLSKSLVDLGIVVVMIFFASQFISVFKETNIGTIIVGFISNLINMIPFSGMTLIIVCTILIALSSLLLTTTTNKWAMIAPIMVPVLMRQGTSPQFAQFIFRASDSMVKGITPLLPFFIVFVAYLNIYNKDKEKPITIRKALSYMRPYAIGMIIVWLIIIISWYIIGVPIGPSVYPTI